MWNTAPGTFAEPVHPPFLDTTLSYHQNPMRGFAQQITGCTCIHKLLINNCFMYLCRFMCLSTYAFGQMCLTSIKFLIPTPVCSHLATAAMPSEPLGLRAKKHVPSYGGWTKSASRTAWKPRETIVGGYLQGNQTSRIS